MVSLLRAGEFGLCPNTIMSLEPGNNVFNKCLHISYL